MTAEHLESRTETFEAIVVAATTSGKNLLPRIAGLMDLAMVSDVTLIKSPTTVVRPIYAGNGLATVECMEPIILISVRPTVFEAAVPEGGSAEVVSIPPSRPWTRTRVVQRAEQDGARPDLGTAKIVLAGGRGMQTKENFAILARIAASPDFSNPSWRCVKWS